MIRNSVSTRRPQVGDFISLKLNVYISFAGIKQASLGKNDSCLMLEMDPVMTVFPLLLSFNFCVSTPLISPQLNNEDNQLEVVIEDE